MYPFWNQVIAPLIEAAQAERVVEVGALQGETTVHLLEELGPDAELHVIDPVPQFDPAEHERRFPGRYHFHREISHDVLPELGPMDVALIDGDHNWYTVYNELKMLDAAAREAQAPLPILFLHDVGWPYGRRDLYYEPERIPEEFRQPYAQKGIAFGRSELLDEGGLNAGFDNALTEGGPRNGVMTALEDFIEQSDRELRLLVIPAHFGLAVAVDRRRIEASESLAAVLDRLESSEGREEQARLAETIRLGTLIESRGDAGAARAAGARGARRYLELVKGALLDEHYLENEVRLEYLQTCIERGAEPDPVRLRDPRMWLAKSMRRLREARRTGAPLRTLGEGPFFPYTSIGRTGLDRLHDCLDAVRADSVPGDLAACGVWRGGSAMFMRAYLQAYERDAESVWVADTFSGPPDDDAEGEGDGDRMPTLVADLNTVREGFARFDLFDERVRFLQGDLRQTLADAPIGDLALLHIGDETRAGTAAALEQLYERISPGGCVLVEHYDAPPCREAVDAFRARHEIEAPMTRADWAGISWRKSLAAPAAAARRRGVELELRRAPLAPPTAGPELDLSVVVVVYEMQREARRTLHSLSRAYQREVDDLDYEVIVVENGSSGEQALGEDLVRSFGAEFRYLDLGSDASPSPAHALNRGIAASRSRSLALMIDGAHVLTPGVLRFGALALRTYPPAVAMTRIWFVGPGQQGDAISGGYDEEYEDRLFDEIDWPIDGYRLFEIGTSLANHDWFDPLWESNCLFAPRALLEQVGGFDESFSVPGGGYANLDLFERLSATPGVTVVDLLGEASFHQMHGGTTTNQPDVGERHGRLMSYRDQYEELRKRPFRGPGKPRHWVGRVHEPALHTRSRWQSGGAFTRAQRQLTNGQPERPLPLPDESRSQFTDAFWHSGAWRGVSWLGRAVERAPTDLVAYQELVSEVRPDWIIEMRTGAGARAMFFASICDLIGAGQVVSIQMNAEARRPEHPRITYVTGSPTAPETRRRVAELVGKDPRAMLVIPPAARRRVVAEFKAYEELVPLGSYVIFENTVLGGNPVMPEYGPGPWEAVTTILKERRDFAPDQRPERFGLTFNPRGYLKRVEP